MVVVSRFMKWIYSFNVMVWALHTGAGNSLAGDSNIARVIITLLYLLIAFYVCQIIFSAPEKEFPNNIS